MASALVTAVVHVLNRLNVTMTVRFIPRTPLGLTSCDQEFVAELPVTTATIGKPPTSTR
jgi:hypothetical protein